MVSEPCHDPMAGSKDAAKAAAGAKPPERTPSKPRSRSRRDASLSPVRRGRSPGRAHGRELVVRERVVRDGGGSSKWPVLMRTNYADWSVIMRVQLQVHGLWDAVTEDDVDEHDDRAALSALLQAVPPELVRTLAAKDNAKAAWDTLRTLRVGAERVREAKAQTRRRDYDRLAFKDGENVEEFALRLSTILSDLELLGDPEDERKAVRKFLRVLPRKYRQMASSIESLLDLNSMSIEELSGRLLVVEENEAIDGADPSGQLLLTAEEWRAREKRQDGGSGSDNRQGKSRGKGRDDRRPAGEGTHPSNKEDACRYCGKKGHWARECRKKKRDEEKNEAHLVQGEDDADPAMLLAEIQLDAPLDITNPAAPDAAAAAVTPSAPERALVFLNEEKAKVVPGRDDEPVDRTWYLDTGASNHMTGDRSAFVTLDECHRQRAFWRRVGGADQRARRHRLQHRRRAPASSHRRVLHPQIEEQRGESGPARRACLRHPHQVWSSDDP